MRTGLKKLLSFPTVSLIACTILHATMIKEQACTLINVNLNPTSATGREKVTQCATQCALNTLCRFEQSAMVDQHNSVKEHCLFKVLFMWRRASPGTRASSLCRDDSILYLYETLEAGWLAKLNHCSHCYKYFLRT